MSSPALAQVNSTPVKQITTPVPAATESPGNWKHPRLAEITRRQNQNTFSEKNIRQIVYNAGALVSFGLIRQVVLPFVPAWLLVPPERRGYNTRH
jgi:nucleoporin POM34